jgi:hypothetical protein
MPQRAALPCLPCRPNRSFNRRGHRHPLAARGAAHADATLVLSSGANPRIVWTTRALAGGAHPRHLLARPATGRPGRRRSHRGPDRALIAPIADENRGVFLPLQQPKPVLNVCECRRKAPRVTGPSRLRLGRGAPGNRPVQPDRWCRRRDLNPHPPHGGPDFEWCCRPFMSLCEPN